MMSTAQPFPSGVLPVLQTPYNEDYTIDWETLRREINWLLEEKVDGVVIAMVSEVLRLAEDERHELLEKVVEYCAGRVPVIASVGAESTVMMRRLAKESERRGASALMAIPPCLTRLSGGQLLDYYRALLDATTLPVIVQDASGYVGNAIAIELQVALWKENPQRVAFKPEAQPLAQNHARIMELTGGQASVYEGMAGVGVWGGYERGLVGTMPGSDVPWAIRILWDHLVAGCAKEALPIHAALSALVSLMSGLDAFLALEKRLLVEQGIFRNTLVRGPVGYHLDASTEREAMAAYELLKHQCGRE